MWGEIDGVVCDFDFDFGSMVVFLNVNDNVYIWFVRVCFIYVVSDEGVRILFVGWRLNWNVIKYKC